MNKLKQLWSHIKQSLWFVPTVMVLFFILLAIGFITIDFNLKSDYPRIFGAGVDGSREMLSAIAGSMITIAGLTFSLTLVAMAQASSQYTSRILRNFMRDRSNQFVLGYFVGIFSYCVIVLRTIHSEEDENFIPALAVNLGLLLAVASIGVLIFYVHHIASSIQATSIISLAARDTIAAVKRLFPEPVGEEAGKPEEERFAEEIDQTEWQPIESHETGYIQNVDSEGLVDFAVERRGVVRMERGIGEFIVEGSPLASFNGEAEFDEESQSDFEGLYIISQYRTIDQDSGFGIRQLVDIALKGLSPGVNDTTTAIVCIDYLGAILTELAKRRIEHPFRVKDGKVRVIAAGPNFESLANEAFDQIRDVADGSTAVYLRLLGAIETIARQTTSEKRRDVLKKHIELIAEEAGRTLKSDYNQNQVSKRVAKAKKAVKSDVSESSKSTAKS
jgi:uncharacterized membrane protein